MKRPVCFMNQPNWFGGQAYHVWQTNPAGSLHYPPRYAGGHTSPFILSFHLKQTSYQPVKSRKASPHPRFSW